MLIRDATWGEIRHLFSEEEKTSLRAVVTGEAICPKGIIVDRDKLSESLDAKLMLALSELESSRCI